MAASKLVLPLLVAVLLHVATTLKIGAFNIKTFGDSKMSNQTIANIIVSILSEYDIIVVQELRDADLSSVKKLMDQLNSTSLHPYNFLASIPLGRTSYKEQYLYIYRSDMVSVLGSYYYDDGCEPCGTDTFSREPFIVKFSSPTTRVEEFVIVPLHATPSHAPEEIDALYEVYTDVVNKWATNNILLLGDFNADCSYVTSTEWPSIRLRSLDACEWLIPDSADTTVADTTDCAYDRIVACGTALRQDIEPGSATVNNFQKTFHLQRKDALAVSDHFPVEVILKAR
ncbi:deoxyribonuclease-1-like [Falco biarmicus]|uniref:deoxyribonuclease-1-like n=1 Tax=Falco rusticolus TaxID=120794 RepID=UPI00188656D5|nr:deoxyribonuclease-1-like [Falco rusticolus]XP_055565413.1 deoxyribonuclease-1-like [Falco cherrug]XP_056193554.1 deoxyribonuclease-1-like [Falco biarmicus]